MLLVVLQETIKSTPFDLISEHVNMVTTYENNFQKQLINHGENNLIQVVGFL